MCAQMHVLAHISACFVCYEKSFRFMTSWFLVVLFFFFPNTAFLSHFAFSKGFSLACAGWGCHFFLLVCIHTEIWAFCIPTSTCGSIIHHGKKMQSRVFPLKCCVWKFIYFQQQWQKTVFLFYSFSSPLCSFSLFQPNHLVLERPFTYWC